MEPPQKDSRTVGDVRTEPIANLLNTAMPAATCILGKEIADTNERRQVDETLRASEIRYRRLFESAKDGILILDAETGMVVDVNPFLIERLGFSREQFLGKKIWELGFFKDIVANQSSFSELQQNEYIRYEDKPLETADGHRVDVEFVSNVYLVNEQKVIQCNIRDITARKATERLLREQNEILSNSKEGVMIVSLGNKVSLWNRGAEETFGWTAAEALGHPPDRVLGIVDPVVLTTLRDAVQRDGFWDGELPSKTRDGRKLIIHCRTTLVLDAKGQPRARLSFLADITEKKLLEGKFLRAQRLEAIGTLSSGIAHDLNNILAPMLLFAPFLRGKLEDPKDIELLTMIEGGAQRAANIIKQLLTFSRGIEGERGPVQIRHLIKEMIAIMCETFPREIEVVGQIPTDLWPINADSTQIHQVLMNLCVNARDAIQAGGKITLAAENINIGENDLGVAPNVKPGTYVRLTITDTGEGIPYENRDRIFEPFFTTKEVGKGTGLGLSTVLGIVKSHGGFIAVYSELGYGTSFKVHLPAIVCAAANPMPDTIALHRGQQELILIVDDEAALRHVLRLALESSNYRVLVAADGREAIGLFLANRGNVRLVLTDIMMHGMNGVVLIQTLRALEPRLRIVAVSGLTDQERRDELAALGVTSILSKPCRAEEILEAIQRELA